MKTTLNVSGMSCGSCVKHVREALSQLSGVHAVEVRLEEGRADVEHDDTLALERLTDAVKDAGYDVAL